MISDIASLLKEFLDKGTLQIAEEGATHGPTIGAMYEGLAREILNRSIPANLNLQIVNGFIEGADGSRSTQIDCMLVTGDGRQLPYTDSHVWHIKDVLAVFEITKTLHGRKLKDALKKQEAIRQMYHAYWQVASDDYPVNLPRMLKAFRQITGIYASQYSDGDKISDDLSRLIFHYLVTELVMPVQVIFGFEGYVDEQSLRAGVLDLIEESWHEPPFYSPFKLPTLVVCRQNSVLKTTGYPYVTRTADGWWPFLGSNSENPLRIIIELIWAKLENRFSAVFPEDYNLQMERLALLVRAKGVPLGNEEYGWIYELAEVLQSDLDALGTSEWTPDALSMEEAVMVQAAYNLGHIDLSNAAEMAYFTERGSDPQQVLSRLVQLRLLSRDGEHIGRPVHVNIQVAFSPQGIFASGTPSLHIEWLLQKATRRRIEEIG